MRDMLDKAIEESAAVLRQLPTLSAPLSRLGDEALKCWERRGKLLLAGNGGSMADAMHLAEELSVRFRRNRRALAAVALCDPAAITCAGNDFGFETIFERQVEALGNPGDILIVLTTSGRSLNILRAVELARALGLVTVAFVGGNGGDLAGKCDIELRVPSAGTARVQEAHKLLFHTLCDWIDARV